MHEVLETVSKSAQGESLCGIADRACAALPLLRELGSMKSSVFAAVGQSKACQAALNQLKYFCMYRLQRLSLFKLDDDSRHIVSTEPVRGVEVDGAIDFHHHLNHGGQPLKSTIVYCIF